MHVDVFYVCRNLIKLRVQHFERLRHVVVTNLVILYV